MTFDESMFFREKWLEAVDRNNSVLCAGLDPAEYEMERGPKGLPEGMDKTIFSLLYVQAVAPHVAAVKPNLQYWKDIGDMQSLRRIVGFAHDLGLVVIDDSKLADIGSTNDAGLYHAGKHGFDAVTYSPHAGNIDEIAAQAEERRIGVIGMCLMSNPEYAEAKNRLVCVTSRVEDFREDDVVWADDDQAYVRQYIFHAEAYKRGRIEMVIGAPSPTNHITEEELAATWYYAGDETLILLPGVGEQGGEAQLLWNGFEPDQVIVNVGRSLMFPEGSQELLERRDWDSLRHLSQLHATTARHYQRMLNEMRAK